MSEQINKVLASTAQSFDSAQQAQARDNIGAIGYANLDYSGSAITGIGGSAVGGGLGGVEHDSNLTGSGTSGSKLGLSSKVILSSTAYTGEYSTSGMRASTDGYLSQLSPYQLYQTGYAGNATSFYTAERGVGGTVITKTGGGLATWGPSGDQFYVVDKGYNYTAWWDAAYSANQTFIKKYDSNGEYMSAFIYPDYYQLDHWWNKYDTANSSREMLELRTTGIRAAATANNFTWEHFNINKNYIALWSGRYTIWPHAGTIGSTADGTLGYISWQNDANSLFVEVRSGDAGARSVLGPDSLRINNSLSQDANKYSMNLSLSSLTFVDETNGNEFYVFNKDTYNTLTSLSAWATSQGWTP